MNVTMLAAGALVIGLGVFGVEASAQERNLRARPPMYDGAGAIYLPSSSGVYRSVDGGKSWKEEDGLGDPIVMNLATDGRGAVFAGTSRGFYKRTAGGGAWTDITIEEDNPNHNGGIIFAADKGKVLFTLRRGYVYRSTDAGKSWKAAAGLPRAYYDDMLEFPGKLYIVHQHDKTVYESVDKGERWRISPRFAPLNGFIAQIVADGDTIHVLSTRVDIEENRILFKGAEAGSSWDELSIVVPRYGKWLGASSGTVYATGSRTEFLRSKDLSAWTTCSTTNKDDTLDPDWVVRTPHGLFMNMFWYGLFRSTDGGATWTAAMKGLPPTRIPAENQTIRLACR